ncbi:hypothetical protein ACWDYH_35245 [Nocardia goodfellowii]
MKLAWARPELHRLCQSADGLARLWPQDAADARRLLTMIGTADTLFDLTHFRSLRVTVEESANQTTALSVTAHHVEVTLKGTLVNTPGSPTTARPTDASTEWMRDVRAILVGDLLARGQHAMKASA